jgi:hypothetical protein
MGLCQLQWNKIWQTLPTIKDAEQIQSTHNNWFTDEVYVSTTIAWLQERNDKYI